VGAATGRPVPPLDGDDADGVRVRQDALLGLRVVGDLLALVRLGRGELSPRNLAGFPHRPVGESLQFHERRVVDGVHREVDANVLLVDVEAAVAHLVEQPPPRAVQDVTRGVGPGAVPTERLVHRAGDGLPGVERRRRGEVVDVAAVLVDDVLHPGVSDRAAVGGLAAALGIEVGLREHDVPSVDPLNDCLEARVVRLGWRACSGHVLSPTAEVSLKPRSRLARSAHRITPDCRPLTGQSRPPAVGYSDMS